MLPSMDVAPDGTVYIAYGARQAKYSADPADVYLGSIYRWRDDLEPADYDKRQLQPERTLLRMAESVR